MIHKISQLINILGDQCHMENVTEIWGQKGWKVRVEILNPHVKENPVNPAAEQRLQYGKGMSLLDTPPFSPTPYSSLSSGFLVHHLRKTR